jgi:hypothetical protein
LDAVDLAGADFAVAIDLHLDQVVVIRLLLPALLQARCKPSLDLVQPRFTQGAYAFIAFGLLRDFQRTAVAQNDALDFFT